MSWRHCADRSAASCSTEARQPLRNRRKDPIVSTSTLASLAALVGGKVEGDGQVAISGASSISRSQEGDITLADVPRLVTQLGESQASAVVVGLGIRLSVHFPQPGDEPIQRVPVNLIHPRHVA